MEMVNATRLSTDQLLPQKEGLIRAQEKKLTQKNATCTQIGAKMRIYFSMGRHTQITAIGVGIFPAKSRHLGGHFVAEESPAKLLNLSS
jgi:hypothetical protein